MKSAAPSPALSRRFQPRFTLVTMAVGGLGVLGGVMVFRDDAKQAATTRPVAMSGRLVSAGGAVPAVLVSVKKLQRPVTRGELLAALREKLGAGGAADETLAALAGLAATDAALAIDLAHALGRTEEEKTAWVSDLARRWAGRAPQEAWDWLQQQDQPRLRELATGELPAVMLGAMARGDGALLLRNVDQLLRAGEGPVGVSPVVAVHLGLDALVANGQFDRAREAVEAWAGDPARPAIGEAAYVTVAVAWAATDPAAAGAWLKALPPSADREVALVEFPAQWAQTDARAALGWVEANVTADERPRAIQRSFGDWAERSPADAAEWLSGYLTRAPASAEADRLIGAVINLGPALKADPAAALQWTALISDPVARAASEEKVVLRWARLDAAAAGDYLARSPTIPPERKSALQQKMKSPTFKESEG